jgi:hypothetical protein
MTVSDPRDARWREFERQLDREKIRRQEERWGVHDRPPPARYYPNRRIRLPLLLCEACEAALEFTYESDAFIDGPDPFDRVSDCVDGPVHYAPPGLEPYRDPPRPHTPEDDEIPF